MGLAEKALVLWLDLPSVEHIPTLFISRYAEGELDTPTEIYCTKKSICNSARFNWMRPTFASDDQEVESIWTNDLLSFLNWLHSVFCFRLLSPTSRTSDTTHPQHQQQKVKNTFQLNTMIFQLFCTDTNILYKYNMTICLTMYIQAYKVLFMLTRKRNALITSSQHTNTQLHLSKHTHHQFTYSSAPVNPMLRHIFSSWRFPKTSKRSSVP